MTRLTRLTRPVNEANLISSSQFWTRLTGLTRLISGRSGQSGQSWIGKDPPDRSDPLFGIFFWFHQKAMFQDRQSLENPEFSVLVFMPGAQAARLHSSPKPMTIGLGRVRASHANTGFNCKTGRRAACAPGKCDGKNSGLSRQSVSVMIEAGAYRSIQLFSERFSRIR